MASRFADINSVKQFIEDQENGNTRKKTQQNVALLEEFLTLRNESRLTEVIAPKELNAYIAEFIIMVRKKDSNADYEPSSLRSLMATFERYLIKEEESKLSQVSECFSTTVHSAGSAADYQQGQQAMSLFTGAVIHGGQFNISISSLNQSPTLATPEAEIKSTKRYKRLKVLDSDSE